MAGGGRQDMEARKQQGRRAKGRSREQKALIADSEELEVGKEGLPPLRAPKARLVSPFDFLVYKLQESLTWSIADESRLRRSERGQALLSNL